MRLVWQFSKLISANDSVHLLLSDVVDDSPPQYHTKVFFKSFNMSSESSKSNCDKWRVISGLVNSGIMHCNLLSYPFMLEKEGGLLYFLILLVVSFTVIHCILLIELGVGQLNQRGFVAAWGDMVPILKGEQGLLLKLVTIAPFTKKSV